MTIEKLNQVLLLINDLYPNRAPAITERVVAVWMECFKEYDNETVDQAVMKAIKECKYPPTINDLVGYCDQFVEKRNGIISDIRSVYREITDLGRIGERNEETWIAFRECIADDDLNVSLQKAMELETRWMQMYRERGCMFSRDNNELPPLAGWLKNQRWSK